MGGMTSLRRLLLALALALPQTGCVDGLFGEDDVKTPKPVARGRRGPNPPKARDPRPSDLPAGWESVDAGTPPADPAPEVASTAPTDPPPPPPPLAPPAAPSGLGVHAPLPPGSAAAGTSADDPLYGSFLGKETPDLSADGVWVNPAAAPTLAGLRGQVVFVMFAFQTCPSCGQMTPYLKQWHDMYGPQGLTVLYVNNGKMANLDAVHKAVAEQGLRFAYFHDVEGSTLHAFGIRSFPTAYLIDRTGKVAWEGTPLAIESQVQEKIVELLAVR